MKNRMGGLGKARKIIRNKRALKVHTTGNQESKGSTLALNW